MLILPEAKKKGSRPSGVSPDILLSKEPNIEEILLGAIKSAPDKLFQRAYRIVVRFLFGGRSDNLDAINDAEATIQTLKLVYGGIYTLQRTTEILQYLGRINIRKVLKGTDSKSFLLNIYLSPGVAHYPKNDFLIAIKKDITLIALIKGIHDVCMSLTLQPPHRESKDKEVVAALKHRMKLPEELFGESSTWFRWLMPTYPGNISFPKTTTAVIRADIKRLINDHLLSTTKETAKLLGLLSDDYEVMRDMVLVEHDDNTSTIETQVRKSLETAGGSIKRAYHMVETSSVSEIREAIETIHNYMAITVSIAMSEYLCGIATSQESSSFGIPLETVMKLADVIGVDFTEDKAKFAYDRKDVEPIDVDITKKLTRRGW